MLYTSKEFTNAIRAKARNLFAKVIVDGKTYRDSEIKSISGDFGLVSGDKFTIGSCYSDTIKVTFKNILESIDLDQTVWVYFGIEVEDWKDPNDRIQYVSMGKFYINDFYRNRNGLETTIEAADGFIYMGGAYESKLKYPAEIRKVALEICNQAGIEVDQTNFSRLSSRKIEKISGYTYRDAIGLIAQLHAGFGNFNREGKFEIRSLQQTNCVINDSEYYLKGLEAKETKYKTDGIQVKVKLEKTSTDDSGNASTTTEEQILTAGSDSGNVIELENPVMNDLFLEEIWNKVKDIIYLPYEVEWQGNPALEAGDWLTLYDPQKRKFHVPQLLMSFDYNGGLKMKSSAQTSAASSVTYRYKGSLNQTIQYLEDQIAANGTNRIFHGHVEPTNCLEGDIWFKPNGPYIEMWIYTRDENGNLNWVMEVSTAPNQELLDLIANAQKEAEDAQDAAEKAYDDAIAESERQVQEAEDAWDSKMNTVKEQFSQDLATGIKEIRDDVQPFFDKAEHLANIVENPESGLVTKVTQIEQGWQVTAEDLSAIKDAIPSEINPVNSIHGSWEQGDINTSTGQEATSSNYCRMTGYVEVTASERLISVTSKGVAKSTYFQWYDENKTYLSYNNSSSVTVPSKAKFLRASTNGSLSTLDCLIFKGDIPSPSYTLKSQLTVLSDQISSKVDNGTFSTQMSQLSDQINLRVMKDQVLTQLNLSPSGVYIKGDLIQLDGNVKMATAFVTKLYADSGFVTNFETKAFNAVKAKIGQLEVTNVKAGIITANHLKVDTAMIDKLFATTAYIERLTSKTAFINSINALDINANRIKTGTLNAAIVNLINMNASNITTGYLNAARIASRSITADKLTADAIQVGLNSLGSTIKISSTALAFYNGTSKVSQLTYRGMEFWNGDTYVGRMGATFKTSDPSIRGLGTMLAYSAEFITWTFRYDSTSTKNTTVMTLDPFGKMYPEKGGLHLDTSLWLKSGHRLRADYISDVGANVELQLRHYKVDGNPGLFIGNDNGGIFVSNYGNVCIKYGSTWFDVLKSMINK